MKPLVVLAAATLVCGCTSLDRQAASRGISGDVVRAFRDLDADGDGYVSREEARRSDNVARSFDLADRNGDGKLDLEEFRMMPAH